MSILFEDENLRHVVAEELAQHRDVIELVDRNGDPDGNGDRFRYGCTCGHVRGIFTERQAVLRMRQSGEEQRLHVADALILTLRAEEAGAIEDNELEAWEQLRAERDEP